MVVASAIPAVFFLFLTFVFCSCIMKIEKISIVDN